MRRVAADNYGTLVQRFSLRLLGTARFVTAAFEGGFLLRTDLFSSLLWERYFFAQISRTVPAEM